MEQVNNVHPPIPKLVLKRIGQKYKIFKSKSKRSKRKPRSKSIIYHGIETEESVDIILIDSSDEDVGSESIIQDYNNPKVVIEIDSSGDEDNVTSMLDRYKKYLNEFEEPQSMGNNQAGVYENCAASKSQASTSLRRPTFVDLSLDDYDDDDNNNNVQDEVKDGLMSAKSDGELEQVLGLKDFQTMQTVRKYLTHLSELLFVIINSRRDYSHRVLGSERLCNEFIRKEKTIAEDIYSNLITEYGYKFTHLFFKMEDELENLKQNSFMVYNFIAFRLFVGVNKIERHTKISFEFVKKLMILLLKRNSHKSLVFDVFKEESVEESLSEFESAFFDCSYPEAYIPLED